LQAAANNNKLTALPPGLSPFEKSLSKSIDVQGNFRKVAGASLARALREGRVRTEIDFPPLLGGDQSKSNFDDFDNVQELNANRDWCVQLLPALNSATTSTKGSDTCWLVLPDDKEVELAKDEWKGQRFRQACQFTSIRAAVTAAGGALKLAWGSTLASTVDKLQGGDGILADTASLDSLDPTTVGLTLVCQPGNGGPVEDWINVEQLQAALPSNSPFCIVNGALDKVVSSTNHPRHRTPQLLPHLLHPFPNITAGWLLPGRIFSGPGRHQGLLRLLRGRLFSQTNRRQGLVRMALSGLSRTLASRLANPHVGATGRLYRGQGCQQGRPGICATADLPRVGPSHARDSSSGVLILETFNWHPIQYNSLAVQ
jgi:hypothetical protein